jgi:hypothetical protein
MIVTTTERKNPDYRRNGRVIRAYRSRLVTVGVSYFTEEFLTVAPNS